MWLLWWGRKIWLSPLFSLLPHFLLFLWSPCFSLISLPFKSWHLIFYRHQTPAALLPSLHRMSLWKKKSLAQPKAPRTPSNRCVSSSGLPTWCPWWSLWVCSPVSLADHGTSFLSRLGVLDLSVHSKVPLPHAPVHTPACSFGLEWEAYTPCLASFLDENKCDNNPLDCPRPVLAESQVFFLPLF